MILLIKVESVDGKGLIYLNGGGGGGGDFRCWLTRFLFCLEVKLAVLFLPVSPVSQLLLLHGNSGLRKCKAWN